jgi:hypothetical protein
MKDLTSKKQFKGNTPPHISPKEVRVYPFDKEKERVVYKLLVASVGTMVLTTLHHIYGAIIYETPFRLHIAFIAIPVIAVLFLTYWVFHKYLTKWFGKLSFWMFLLTALLFPIGIIGIIEGGFNHLLKNILFFGGSSQAILEKLFPPPTYEMPNDFWFEFSGILQFFIALYAAFYLWLILMRKRRNSFSKS